MSNIIIAFSKDKACDVISGILKQNGIIFTHTVKTSSALRQACTQLENAIVICNNRFMDENIFNIIQDFHENFTFVVIGDYSQIDALDDDKCYKVSVPIQKEEFLSIIDLAIYKHSEKVKDINKKNLNKAKDILINKLNMSEENAHKYIQQKSMNTGKNIHQICKLIIKKYSSN
ncbi:MAG: ANTAR domain-containing protein [bacterium]